MFLHASVVFLAAYACVRKHRTHHTHPSTVAMHMCGRFVSVARDASQIFLKVVKYDIIPYQVNIGSQTTCQLIPINKQSSFVGFLVLIKEVNGARSAQCDQ